MLEWLLFVCFLWLMGALIYALCVISNRRASK